MINVNLVGNPNTGKTTLFNMLTSSHEHVGNWHGVTVEEKAKVYYYKDNQINLVDLPGIYSLSPLSYEEEVACDYLLKHKDRLIINICDASNLQRNLYLTLSLMELGCPILLVINQIDKRMNYKIDFKLLSQILSIPVIYINADDKNFKDTINQAIIRESKRVGNVHYNLPYLKSLTLPNLNLSEDEEPLKEFYQIKLLEDDERVKARFGIKQNFDMTSQIASLRYDYIDDIAQKCFGDRQRVYGKSKLDKILLNRFLAFPIFILFIAVAFYITFFSLGSYFSDVLSFFLEKYIGIPLINLCTDVFGDGTWIVKLIEEALIGGVGSIVTFLPQVALLFFFLSLLEDSGYLSRVAFVFEDILGKVGLSGKSVYTLLMGFGCSTTAVLTARNMDDKNSKIKTGLLTPYMSCSAKFPIYAVLGGAFFGASNIFVIIAIYFIGVIVAILMSYLFEKTILKSKTQSFILEFPPYRMMSFKRIGVVLWQNVKMFIVRVGSLILAMNVIVWILSNFSFTFKYVSNDGVSMLESLGKIFAPIFAPLGFNSWGLVSALIAGLIAKEVIVSSIAMFNGTNESSIDVIQNSLFDSSSAVYFASGASVFAFLVFCLLYFPCLATISVLSKEIGKKWTFIGVVLEFVVAYIVTMFVYNIARLCEIFGLDKILIYIIVSIIVIASITIIIKKIKSKNSCKNCKNCSGHCR